LLLVVGMLVLAFGFRGLVKLAFIFDASPLVSFLLAPALLPAAALPALCLLYVVFLLPYLWQRDDIPLIRKVFATVAALPVAFVIAVLLDLIETILLLRMGIRLPRLPLEFY
jgi:hypothetical protein